MCIKSKVFFGKMMDFLPCTVESYNKSIEEYGELLETVVIEDVFMPEIIKLVNEDENHKLLKETFNYFEVIVHFGEQDLVSNFQVTVLEILGNDKVILKTAQKYMGEKTNALQIEADRGLGRL